MRATKQQLQQYKFFTHLNTQNALCISNKKDFNQLVHIVKTKLPFKLTRVRELTAMSLGDYKTSNSLVADIKNLAGGYITMNANQFCINLEEVTWEKHNTAITADELFETMLSIIRTPFCHYISQYAYPYKLNIDSLLECVKDSMVEPEEFDLRNVISECYENKVETYLDVFRLAREHKRPQDAEKVLHFTDKKHLITKTPDYAEHLIDLNRIDELKCASATLKAKQLTQVISYALEGDSWRNVIPTLIGNKKYFKYAYEGLMLNVSQRNPHAFEQLRYFHSQGYDLKQVHYPASSRKGHYRITGDNILYTMLEAGGLYLMEMSHEQYRERLDFLFDEVGFHLNDEVETKMTVFFLLSFSIPYLLERLGTISCDLTDTVRDLIHFKKYESLEALRPFYDSVDVADALSDLPRNTKLSQYLTSRRVNSYEWLVDAVGDIRPMIISGAKAKSYKLKKSASALVVMIGTDALQAGATDAEIDEITHIANNIPTLP